MEPRPKPRAVFTEGSTLRHVLVMTATGSIGLVAIFAVDLLSLLYVSWLGDPKLTAAVGFATQIMFFLVSINIGLSIAITALVAQALGAGDRPRAQRLAASGLMHIVAISILVSLCAMPFRREMLALLGAQNEVLDIASRFLAITLPSNVLMATGMAMSGVLRAVGDAKRSMYVTLFGAVATAIADPILIFAMKLGIDGAAIATNLSRCVFAGVGLYGAVYVHGLVARPQRRRTIRDLAPMMMIAGPAILTNLAAPVANSYALSVFARFGEEIVAAFAIIDRVTPVAFGVLFAMSGSVGPIMSQNYGAGLIPRVRATLTNCLVITVAYSLVVWAALYFASPSLNALFNATGETARLVTFFCTFGAAAWLFLGFIFVSNAAFNNLGFPILSTLFNWGRATLGTIPFVTIGAHYGGPEGGLLGMIVGAAIFGIGASSMAFIAIDRLKKPILP
ncbi:MAG: MATE family efflux transporter [Beijerinckiaceae bacterium]|nr:MATE family efflux transporter [Beijerinckiaceae bacterium]